MIQFNTMQTFGELLTEYMRRTGISDSELARSIGVQRQTIFRWKEGSVARPRIREDVLHCATRLRLSPEERDLLLLAAGFPPETATTRLPEVPTESTKGESTKSEIAKGEIPIVPIQTVKIGAIADETVTDTPQEPTPVASFLQNNEAQIPEIKKNSPSWLRLVWIAPLIVLLGAIGILLPRWINPNDPPITPTPIQLDSPPTETLSPTPIPTPTITQARTGEQLIIISDFHNRTVDQGYNISGRIEEALASEIRNNQLLDVRTIVISQVLQSKEEAQEILSQSKAALVIWGEYDSGRVVVRYADQDGQRQISQELQTPGDLPVLINKETPNEVKALALATLGQIYRKNGKEKKAQSVLQLALAQKPEAKDIQARALFYLARIAEKESEQQESVQLYDQAIDYYTQLAGLNPLPEKDWVNVWYNRGTAYRNRAEFFAKASTEITSSLSAAIADFDHTLSILPTYEEAFLNRGVAYYDRQGEGDLEQALVDFDQTLKLDPDYGLAYFVRGLARLRKDATSDWEADFLKAQELKWQPATTYIALCWGHVVTNQLEKAQNECEQMRQLNDNSAEHADLQAILAAQLGDLKTSLSEAQRHLQWLKSEPPQLFERKNGPLVEEWIVQLEKEQNPFDAAMLDRLRRGE